jgi:hypothetical protein
MKRRLALLALATLAAGPALAQQLPNIQTITVPTGGTTVSGKLADSKARSLFYVQGAAGQSMNVAATSPDNNVTFQVWEPGTTARTGPDGNVVLNGKAMHGAGPNDDPVAWIGALPAGGMYLVVVASRRGEASYSLNISLQ